MLTILLYTILNFYLLIGPLYQSIFLSIQKLSMHVCKSDDLCSVPETHMVGRKNQVLKVVVQSRKQVMGLRTKINAIDICHV